MAERVRLVAEWQAYTEGQQITTQKPTSYAPVRGGRANKDSGWRLHGCNRATSTFHVSCMVSAPMKGEA